MRVQNRTPYKPSTRFTVRTKLRQGNVFTPVCHSVHRGGGVCLWSRGGVSATPGRHPPGRHSHHWAHPTSIHPPSRHPLGQTPPTSADTPLGSACWDMVHRWAVRIPLECILVVSVCVCVFLRGLLRTITNIYAANLGGNGS